MERVAKKNIILADCEKEEVEDLKKGFEKIVNEKFQIYNKICNLKRSNINEIKRYLIYIFYPLKFFLRRKHYKYIIGWQQFFAIFFVFWCELFHVKKVNIVISMNFTYKAKKGILGKLYKNIMYKIVRSKYLDYIHILNQNYANEISKEFDVNINKFIVEPFGILDYYKLFNVKKENEQNFALSIGRSNRDYDFLINAWKNIKNLDLVIICDQMSYKGQIPDNVKIISNVTGDKQYCYFINAKMCIIPIKQGNICSGDTVVLTSMCFKKITIVTENSTLAENYIRDGINGYTISKKEGEFERKLNKILNSNNSLISENARNDFLNKYTREKMGENVAKKII